MRTAGSIQLTGTECQSLSGALWALQLDARNTAVIQGLRDLLVRRAAQSQGAPGDPVADRADIDRAERWLLDQPAGVHQPSLFAPHEKAAPYETGATLRRGETVAMIALLGDASRWSTTDLWPRARAAVGLLELRHVQAHGMHGARYGRVADLVVAMTGPRHGIASGPTRPPQGQLVWPIAPSR